MKHVAVLAFMLAAGPAFGQPLPDFSIEKHCESAGEIHDYCVQTTQEIYGRLQERWESISPEVRGRCLKWLKTLSKPDSYYQLEGCARIGYAPATASAGIWICASASVVLLPVLAGHRSPVRLFQISAPAASRGIAAESISFPQSPSTAQEGACASDVLELLRTPLAKVILRAVGACST